MRGKQIRRRFFLLSRLGRDRKEIDPPRVLRLDLSLTHSNFGQSELRPSTKFGYSSDFCNRVKDRYRAALDAPYCSTILYHLAEEIAQADAFILLVGEKGVGDWQELEYVEALDKRVATAMSASAVSLLRLPSRFVSTASASAANALIA